jgi:subtilase family serine protease
LIRGNRQLPDVSAVADEFTPYAEYCAGNPQTDSACATYISSDTVYGWFGDGGTSFSAPLWAGVIADRDGFTGHRAGCINPSLYELYAEGRVGAYLHDITGIGQRENTNGFFPVRPGYDMATGLGTPRIEQLVTGPLI